jgi:predicted Zn-dependent peptidase
MSPTISKLSNGLTVATLAMPGLETAAVGLYIDAGSRFEAAHQNGAAHMLEHMVFKGTRKRSAREIAESIEAVGGVLNAYTSRDQTTFYARVLGDDTALGLELVSDLVVDPVLAESEIVRERDVVLQEWGQSWDTPDDVVFEHLSAVAFPEQGLGRPVLGTPDTIRELTGDTLRGYRDLHYRADSMVLAAAGKVDHDLLIAQAEAALGGLPSGTRPQPLRGAYVGGEFRDERAIEQTHVTLAVPAVAYTDPDFYAVMLFSTLLGGGMSSRLFQEVREERGLVYSIYAFPTAFAETGLFSIYLGCGPETVAEAVHVTLDQFRAAADHVSDAELHRARAQAKASLFMSLESCSALSEQLGRQLLIFGRSIPTQEIVTELDAITADQVAAAGRRLITSGGLSLACVGPCAQVPDYDSLVSQLA